MTQTTPSCSIQREFGKESMKFFRFPVFLSLLAFSFGASVLAADVPKPAKKRPPARESKRPAPEVPRPGDVQYSDQPGQVVYQVLLAEIALQRGNIELASNAYADLSLRTRDPRVLERTVEVAGYARRFDLATEAARLWMEVEPESKRAQQMMVSVLVLSGRLDDLAPHLIRMLETDRATLPDNLLGLNRMFVRNQDRAAVFRLIEAVGRAFPELPEAHYAVALAAGSAAQYDRARAEVRRALELRPDWEMAAVLNGQLLMRESPSEAVSFMEAFIASYPKARDVQLNLARALVAEKRYDDARHHFEQLLQAYPESPDIVFPVAVLALQQNDLALAEKQFKHLLSLDIKDKSLANYYLGQIAEEQRRHDEALAYYAAVGPGERYVPAQLRRANLLAGQGRLDEARQLLREAPQASPEERIPLAIGEAGLLREANQTQAAFDLLDRLLERQPEQPELLYESALLAEKLGRIEVMESRLRKLMVLRPDSPQAYNALGYSYADRNIRLPEARELIEKALKLAPEDHYIIDSLGWVLYRQGDLAGALVQLERAYGLRADPEVARHLAEVLWAQGRGADALRVLREAQEKFPGNEALAEAIKKFSP